jgi:hypothetical protein
MFLFELSNKIIHTDKEGNVVPVLNAMKAYGEWKYSFIILDLGTNWK